jgi:hypothetical protein
MGFGTTPKDTDQIPLSAAYQEDNALLPIRGIRSHTDGFGNTTIIPEVGAASGDFAAGSIVDLATLLTLAGTSADANTVASIFGRLTKIRDLLAATLTISGTVTEANSASILTDLAILAGTVSSSKVLTTETNSGSIKSDLDTLAGIVSSSKAAVKSATGDIVDLATLAGIVSSSKAAVKAGAGDFADLATIAGAISSSKMQATIAAVAASLSQANQIPVSNAAPSGVLTISETSLTANSDNTVTFSATARRIRIQNESAGTIYWRADGVASTAYPSLAAPGSNAVSVEWIAVQCSVLHIWVPSGGTTVLNGSGGVKVTAWA